MTTETTDPLVKSVMEAAFHFAEARRYGDTQLTHYGSLAHKRLRDCIELALAKARLEGAGMTHDIESIYDEIAALEARLREDG